MIRFKDFVDDGMDYSRNQLTGVPTNNGILIDLKQLTVLVLTLVL
jgi:hypothetical protein